MGVLFTLQSLTISAARPDAAIQNRTARDPSTTAGRAASRGERKGWWAQAVGPRGRSRRRLATLLEEAPLSDVEPLHAPRHVADGLVHELLGERARPGPAAAQTAHESPCDSQATTTPACGGASRPQPR